MAYGNVKLSHQVYASGLPGDLVEAVRSLHERLERTTDQRIDQARTELQAQIT